MKILKFFGITLFVVILIAAILVIVAPTDLKVEKTVEINAPKNVIKNQITFFKNFPNWSPWNDLDPDMKEWIEGEDGAVGAKHFWIGNDQVGEGNQEITAIEENQVDVLVTFIKPFESQANSYFKFKENNEQSVSVTWGFDSKMPRPFNIFSLFMNMDEEIGKDYQKGLDLLKEHCEMLAETEVN